MAVEIARAYVQLQPSARGFQAAAEREMGPQLRRASEKAGDDSARGFGSKFTGGLRTAGRAAAVGFAAGFAGAAVLGEQAISAASDLEETQSKVNTVFGDGAGIVNEFARTAATSLGQSRQQALDAAGSFGNMFVQLGIGADTAAGMSVQMTTLASDFASFHNADITEVLSAQQAAFRGEYDAVQRFVPTINAAAVEQKALEMGLADTTGELDAQDKALATQALLMEGAGDAAGDFQRTSGGLANQQRILAARFQDAKASIGAALLPAMTAVVGFISEKVIPAVQGLAERWMPRLKAGFEAVSGFISDRVIPAVQQFADTWMPRLRAGFETVIGFVRDNWPQVASVVQSVFDAVVPALQDFADFWIPRLQSAFQGVVEMVQRNWPAVREVIASVFQALSDAWVNYGKPAIDAVLLAVQNVARWFQEHWPQITTTTGEVFQAIGRGWEQYGRPAFDAVVKAGKTVVQWVVDNWPGISSAISGVFSAVGDAWRKYGKPAFDAVVEAGKAVITWIQDNWYRVGEIFTFFRDSVYRPIMDTVWALRDNVKLTLEAAVRLATTVWSGIVAVFNFFRDSVYRPITDTVWALRDNIKATFEAAVRLGTTAWDGMKAVYTFFRDSVFTPVRDKVVDLKNAVVGAFQGAVDGVKGAWDLLKNIVKSPINAVIGFYNEGIRGVWNGVISKIPGVGDLARVQPFAKGGWVPGTGSRDTVPAMLTPGEFVVTKQAAKAWGSGVLHALNTPGGTIDPGIFGYAGGGYVRSADEALAWAKSHAGKPYRFPDVGPNTFDCCLTPDSMVYGPDGATPISELAAGHRVWSCVDGRMETHTVTAAWRSKDQDVFAVRTRARTVNGSANHPFLRVVPKDRQTTHHEDASWEPTTDRVQRGTQSACAVSTCNRRAFSQHLCTMHLQRLRTHGDPRITVTTRIEYEYEWARLDQLRRGDLLVQPRTLGMDAKPDPVLPDGTEVDADVAWLIGAAVGDGSVTDSGLNLCLYGAKRDRATAILRDRWGCAANPHDTHGIVASSVRLARALTEMGMRRLGPEKRVPEAVWSWSESLQRAFLDGYCDADGHRPADQKRHGERTYSSASRRLIDEVRALHVALGDAVANVTTNHRTKPITIKGRVVRHARPLHSFAVWRGVRTGESNLRQRPGLSDLLDAGDVTFAPVLDVRHLGASETWDIEVEGAHNFVADGIIVHNSGLTSALINYVLGLNPWRRRHSSGTVGSDPAVARGAGDNPNGILFGARPPYMTNAQGARVGHIAASVQGVGVEATPPRVRVGGAARGANSSTFTQMFHLPGFGGLSAADEQVAASVAGLSGMRTSGGKPPLGDLLEKMVNRLPGMIFDFFMKQLPSLIVDAVKDAIGGVASGVRDLFTQDARGISNLGHLSGYADGGIVRRNGPILVGEDGPEGLWASRGMYIQSNHELGGRGGSSGVSVGTVNVGTRDDLGMVGSALRDIEWRRRAVPVVAA